VTALKAGPGTGLVEVGLRCLVVGGNAEAMNELVRLLRGNPTVGRVVTARDGTTALRVLHSTEVDLAFIELRMPGMDGADLAGVLGRFRAAPAVVFTAQDPEGAAEAFELGAVDYLTRPLPPARLDRSVRRVQAMRHPTGPVPDRQPVPTGTRGTPARGDDEVIVVCLAGTTRLVRRSSVRWAQAQRDYVRLHTEDGSYLIRARMSTLAEDWAGTGLVRIHRSYLVRLDCVDGVQTTQSGHLCVTIDRQALPVSRRLVPDIWRMMAGSKAA
jgi:DNA-binding LytR/AlgR family response regulator